MTLTCDYCRGPISKGGMKCASCGAPFVRVDAAQPDFRVCPFCSRRLLALGSPACNYCGHQLPDAYLKAREGDLKRMTQVKDGEETSEVGRKVDELFRENLRRKRASSSGPLGMINIAGFFDFFS